MTYFLNARQHLQVAHRRCDISRSFNTVIYLVAGCCIIIMYSIKWNRNDVLIVATMTGSLIAVRLWYCTNFFKKLNSQWINSSDSTSRAGYIYTLIAARWTVWGMHHMRASFAGNGMPCSSHRRSSDVINVLLLVALSITIAITHK